MNKTNKLLWLYLTGFFIILVLPLLNLPPWFSPPDWGKTVVFRSIVAIMLVIFIWQILKMEEVRPLPKLWQRSDLSLTFWLLLALLGIFLLATIFSLDRTFSFWGNPYRSGGFLNFAFYIIFAILAFLILRKSDWQKIWIFSFVIAILVCLIAIFQEFKIFSKVFVPAPGGAWSTIGGSTFLAIYLLLLGFLALVFGLKTKGRKKIFYFFCLFLFIFTILITGSRAAYFGLLLGFLYFILAFPRKLAKLKILSGICLVLVIFTIYYLNTQQPLPKFVEENKIFQEIKPRLSIGLFLNDPRFSVWRISSKALAAKPILGYGPENFSIAFDKYYDPSLPRMTPSPEVFVPISWYDRAHNFLFDIGISAGIPALIIYISLFASIFWALEKTKKTRPDKTLICHGVQAAFLGYLTANFFNFDIFSTYLISFLLIGFSLKLISQDIPEKIISIKLKNEIKYPVLVLLFIGLCWFIWQYNVKPFQINTEINMALSRASKGQPERALKRMETILPSDTFLNEYLRANYIEIINTYILREPQKAIRLVPRGIEITRQAIDIRPNYTRYWLMLGNYYNILLKNYQTFYPEYVEEWKNEANNAFEKLEQLTPKRQEIFIAWAKTYFFVKDFQTAKEKIQKCIDLNPEYGACWWYLALIDIKENNIEEAKKNIGIAETKNYPIDDDQELLLDLKQAYLSLENYEQYLKEICELNYKLRKVSPDNPNYKINVLACYMRFKEYEKIKEVVDDIVKHWESYGEKAEEVLLVIRRNLLALDNYQDYYEDICRVDVGLIHIDETNPQYKIDLVDCFLKTGKKQAAQELAAVIRVNWPEYTEEVNKLIREAGL